jgi:hypothetical protein
MSARARFAGLIPVLVAARSTAAGAPVPATDQGPVFKVEVSDLDVDVVVPDFIERPLGSSSRRWSARRRRLRRPTMSSWRCCRAGGATARG